MPTGYTAAIKEGISFNDFVMQCARAMGACVTMRDDSHNAEIPSEFKPSTYHIRALGTAQSKLESLKLLSPQDAELSAKEEFEEAIESHTNSISSNNELRHKYQNMLQNVKEWQPPSPEHQGFKRFMVEQITSSIEFDCSNRYYLDNSPKRLSGADWLSKEIGKAIRDIDYYTKENQEEIDRANGRTVWIKQLRASLNIK